MECLGQNPCFEGGKGDIRIDCFKDQPFKESGDGKYEENSMAGREFTGNNDDTTVF